MVAAEPAASNGVFDPAGKLLGLLAGDVARPIGHLKLGIEMPDLEALVGETVDRVQMQERELRGVDGRSWLLRVYPYRTADNRLDGAVLVLIDVDELRRAQTALQETSDYANAIIGTVREPLLVLDAQLRVQSANRAFHTTFRVSQNETVGRLVFELGNRQWDIPALRQLLGEVLSQNTPFADFEVKHDFESIGPKVMRLNARRIVRDGNRIELILLAIEDHTELARLEAQDQRHVAQLVQDSQSKTTFLALLAHELRNPLAPIRNGLHLLEGLSNMDVAEARRVLGMLDRQTRQLTRLVDDLLDVARISRGRIDVRRQSGAFNRTCGQATPTRSRTRDPPDRAEDHSHSIVAGGLPEMS